MRVNGRTKSLTGSELSTAARDGPNREHWHFSLSHANSVRSVIEGKVDAAPVASDILNRLVTKGDVAKDSFRVIYESALFPPVAIGCAYNLPNELREAIQAALLELDWSDTKLAREMSPGEAKKFVSVVYLNDWASVRAIDQAVNSVRNQIAAR
ncbi:PhnD/SsuA/transferrin family substrate-binding protein [Pirellulales bacterium]|nr:PhnD/SsuA/transferrin family substrate-binding protein [Pirellulales bacterium]